MEINDYAILWQVAKNTKIRHTMLYFQTMHNEQMICNEILELIAQFAL